MVNRMKNLNLRIFIIAFISMILLAIVIRGNVETDILKTLFPQNAITNADFAPMMNRSSSFIKVIFESDSEQNLETLKQEFENEVDKKFFDIDSPDISKLMVKYKSNPTNFLSNRTRELLKAEKYDDIYAGRVETLYSPAGQKISASNKDPFLLLDDYIASNKRFSRGVKKINDKYYDTFIVKIKNSNGLSSDITNKKISELIKLQKKLSVKPSKIYLAGTPVHSFYTGKRTIFNVNIIWILSVIMILALTYYYFRDIKLLLPMALSISFGILSGFVGTKIWFDNFQIQAILFSTVLIGIGLDYSYRYFFAEKIDRKFLYNLSISLLVTALPFILFYCLKIELLKQIAVFTITGLIAIYLTIIFIYPYFEIYKPTRKININTKFYKYFLIGLSCFCLIGFTGLKFNDSTTAIYTPTHKLKKAEQLYIKVSGDELQNTQIIMVSGKNLENLIEKEEEITNEFNNEDIEYVSLSKFMPSQTRQRDNDKLVKNLYNTTLHKFSDIFSYEQIRAMKNRRFSPVIFDISDFQYNKEFMLNPNTSMIFVFSDKSLFINNKSAKLINLKSDVSYYLRKYRVNLLCLFPITILLLTIAIGLITGSEKAIKIVSPALYGGVGALGLTSIFFGEINYFSVIALYLIIGFAVNYSILRINETKDAEDTILVSCAATTFSFILLALTGIKLLSSIATMTFFGAIISYLSGFFIFKGNVPTQTENPQE